MSETLTILRETIGDDATLKLVAARGGTTVFVPREAKEGHLLADLLGVEAAALLEERWGGEYLTVPIAREFRIDALLARGDMTAPEIALATGAHEDMVRRRRRRLKLQERPRRRGVASKRERDDR